MLVHLVFCLSGAVESESAEHCIIDETTGRKTSIDDDAILNVPDNDEEEEEEDEDDDDGNNLGNNAAGVISSTNLGKLDKTAETRKPKPAKPIKPKKPLGGRRPNAGRPKKKKAKYLRLVELRRQKREREMYEQRKKQMEALVTSSSVYMDVDNESSDAGLFLGDKDFSQPMSDSDETGLEIKEEFGGSDKEYVAVADTELLAALTEDGVASLPPPIEGVESLFKTN